MIYLFDDRPFALQPPLLKEKCLSYSLNKIRHEYTPYDYEWQTGKRDDADHLEGVLNDYIIYESK